ncbi:MAG: type VI secretion system protein TssA [Planctomycetes bacterium]|nr:type VI secretion system protein TssA [Planctomycetota bacterium]
MPSFDENPILELGKNPIPGAAPCGEDASEDEQYILVDAEINKLGRIEADEPDWYRIEQAAVSLLQNKVKDLEIAGSLGLALFKRCRYAGLAAALGLFLELLNNFWDDVLPTRLRRRKARIEMLPDQFADGGWISENKPQPDDFDGIDSCVERIEALKTVLTEKMPDDPPDFAKFTRAIKGLAGQRPKPAEAAPAAAAPEAGAPAAAAAGGAFAGGEVTDKSGATNAVMTAATFLRKADPTDPRAYALVRVIKWSMISLPTSDGAKFEIPPPEATAVDALTHQLGKSMWENLLKNSEAAFRSSDPLWLDLQRYTASALKGLGSNYEKAHDAVVGQTAALVRRLGDGLFELTYRGGMPLCNGDTKMWIDSEVAVADDGGGGGGLADGRLIEAAGEAKKLAASGKLKEALRSLQDGLAVCTQRRDRFMWRLRIAQLCFDSKRLRLAAPLLEECYEELQRYGISEWEPALAVDAAQTLYRCRKSLMSGEKSPGKDTVDKVHESFALLCQLDPLAALAAEPSGK